MVNRNVGRDFELLERMEAGIVLTGAEVKAARAGHVKLEGAYVKVINNEMFLINAQITINKANANAGYDAQRTRKLLLHRAQILRFKVKMAGSASLTIVPVAWYNKKHQIKLEIALAKGKKIWQVKRIEQRRDEKRQIEKELKERMKR